jgi:hypothetical protein
MAEGRQPHRVKPLPVSALGADDVQGGAIADVSENPAPLFRNVDENEDRLSPAGFNSLGSP